MRRFTDAVSKDVRPLFARPDARHAADQADRAAASAAANYRAACLAQTRAVFIAKLSLALEEADERVFWLAASRRTAERHRRT